MSDTDNHADWWRDAVVYQIYPRSFADSNGDGIGDLRGIISRVPYLAELGVDAVWLSPFYPSPLVDGGYDVADYRDVDPRIGSLDDFDGLVAALHHAGIRLYVDIVPNHCSDQHPWFQAALTAPPGAPERDRFIFHDGLGDDHSLPPSDWRANFGGPAWTPVGDGTFYFHLYAAEQPDWNWDNREVRDDFLTTLRFWSDRGVDGFRVDVAMALSKDLTDPLPFAEVEQIPIGPEHPFYDRDGIDEIYAEWREVFDTYDPPRVAVAELWAEPSPRKARYATKRSLGQAFFFDLLQAEFAAVTFKRSVDNVLSWVKQSGSSCTWVLSNHDNVRHASRYGLPEVADDGDVWATSDRDRRWRLTRGTDPVEDIERGLRRARAATMFMLALPGSAYLYQGEELGLRDVADLPDDVLQDPIFFRDPTFNRGRDGCRVPLPWTLEGPSFGFGSGSAHLPQPSWFGAHAVSVEEGDPTSTLNLYRQALRLRHDFRREGLGEELRWADALDGALHLVRPSVGWHSVTNFTADPIAWPGLPTTMLASSEPWEPGTPLPAETTVWFNEKGTVDDPV
ncbi:MAG: glycoside hydrolase family 13 protein [Propionibacteriaceae bacterium]|jgi:alpha-glucosidase|nr:glycoside hydrolase family 13 protein [Propionibacteriaceae bacterium]